MLENGTDSPRPTGKGLGASAAGRKTPNPYVQAALTYVRRTFSSPLGWTLSITFLFLGAGFLPMALGGNRRDIAAAPLQIPFMLAVAVYSLLVLHLKGQFADARAHLVPGFRRVHALVAGAVALLLTVALPMVLIWLADLRSVGLVALSVFLFGAILCSVALQSNLLSWLIILGIFTTFAEPTRVLIWQLVSGQFELQAIVLLTLGAALALIGGFRLVELTEDMPAYKQPTCIGEAGRCTTGQRQPFAWMLPPAWQERSMEKSMARWANHARRAPTSRWSRVCRWQVGMPGGLFGLFMVFFSFVVFTLAMWSSGQDLRNTDAVYPAMMMFFAMPPCMFWGGFFRRGRLPLLAHELLLPVDRRGYVRQVGVATAIGQIQVWAGVSIGIVMWGLLLGRQTVSLAAYALLLGVFTLLQPWFFGMGAWFARCRTLGGQIGGLSLALCVPMLAATLFVERGPWSHARHLALPLAAIAALLGLLVSCHAYHRWLAADFDY